MQGSCANEQLSRTENTHAHTHTYPLSFSFSFSPALENISYTSKIESLANVYAMDFFALCRCWNEGENIANSSPQNSRFSINFQMEHKSKKNTWSNMCKDQPTTQTQYKSAIYSEDLNSVIWQTTQLLPHIHIQQTRITF